MATATTGDEWLATAARAAGRCRRRVEQNRRDAARRGAAAAGGGGDRALLVIMHRRDRGATIEACVLPPSVSSQAPAPPSPSRARAPTPLPASAAASRVGALMVDGARTGRARALVEALVVDGARERRSRRSRSTARASADVARPAPICSRPAKGPAKRSRRTREGLRSRCGAITHHGWMHHPLPTESSSRGVRCSPAATTAALADSTAAIAGRTSRGHTA